MTQRTILANWFAHRAHRFVIVDRGFQAAVVTLTSLMPQKWTIEVVRRSNSGGTVQATDARGGIGKFDVLVREELDPRSAAALGEPGSLLFLLDQPSIYIHLDGATQDPSPASQGDER